MKTYEVTLNMSFRRLVLVYAEDEDAAVELACDRAAEQYQASGKYEVEHYGTREIKRQEEE